MNLRIAQGALDRLADALQQRLAEFRELVAAEGPGQGAALVDKFDRRRLRVAEPPLRQLRLPAQRAVDRRPRRTRRYSGGAADAIEKGIDDDVDEIVAAEEVVAGGGAHLHDTLEQFEDRNVEGATAEIDYHDAAFLLLLQPVGERRRGRLVEQALDLEAG